MTFADHLPILPIAIPALAAPLAKSGYGTYLHRLLKR